jgi:hypothetical protein
MFYGKELNMATPLKSVRKKCLDCSVYNAAEVRRCEFDDCSLHQFRMGRGVRGESILKAIREYCLWCMNGNRKEVRLCPTKNCPLFSYRLGKNPARAGIGKKRSKTKSVDMIPELERAVS